MSEIRSPEDAAAGFTAPAALRPAADPEPDEEIPAWEAAMVKVSTVVAVWLGY